MSPKLLKIWRNCVKSGQICLFWPDLISFRQIFHFLTHVLGGHTPSGRLKLVEYGEIWWNLAKFYKFQHQTSILTILVAPQVTFCCSSNDPFPMLIHVKLCKFWKRFWSIWLHLKWLFVAPQVTFWCTSSDVLCAARWLCFLVRHFSPIGFPIGDLYGT